MGSMAIEARLARCNVLGLVVCVAVLFGALGWLMVAQRDPAWRAASPVSGLALYQNPTTTSRPIHSAVMGLQRVRSPGSQAPTALPRVPSHGQATWHQAHYNMGRFLTPIDADPVKAEYTAPFARPLATGPWMSLVVLSASIHALWMFVMRKTKETESAPLDGPEVVAMLATTSTEATPEEVQQPVYGASVVPCGDTLDKDVLRLWLPATVNFAILPLCGAVDLFWVGQMGNTIALAAMGAANQIFSSAFWIISFLPSLVSPLIAKTVATGNKEKVQNKVGEAIFVSAVFGALGMFLMFFFPEKAIAVVGAEASVEAAAMPYLQVRALTFIPATIGTVCFATFRGTMDIVTPLKITIYTQLLNVILDPLLIFGWGPISALGLAGAALATCVAEVAACVVYVVLLLKRSLTRVGAMLKPPSWEALQPLLVGGLGVQLRAIALNTAFLAVTGATLAMDQTGTAGAAHAITTQLWQLGGVVLLSLSTIASVLVAQSIGKVERGEVDADVTRRIADRVLMWGLISGVVLGAMQLAALPLLEIFTPLKEVQEAAFWPSIIGSLLQVINGVTFVSEGIIQGHQKFGRLALNTSIATAGLLISLKFMGDTLVGVWLSFWVFNSLRLAGGLHFRFISGPLARRNQLASPNSPPAVA